MADATTITTTPLPQFDAEWAINTPYDFDGVPIVIEYLQGDTRTKVSDTGVTIETLMPAAYGMILGTTDVHGEEIDMYLSPMPTKGQSIYVIDQINPADGQFDEHKVMLGFTSIDEVVQTYIDVFGDHSGEQRLGFATEFTQEAFQQWLKEDGSSLMPASNWRRPDVKLAYKGAGVKPFSKPIVPAARDVAGGVMVALPDLSRGPKIETLSNQAGRFNYHLYFYSALDVKEWSGAIDSYCRILDLANEGDVAHIHVATPGGSVFLMGRLISAMNRTKAKVITYAEGCVASAGTAIWCAGHERHILPGAFFMQHMSSQMLGGKTTDIASKAAFGMAYIEKRLKGMGATGLFTEDEVTAMIDESADIYISGRDAIARMGAVSYRA